ncbi:MAG: HypC/HybG/HupF family hydrogenase formation chaperone [Anaerolineaceae bacterium]|jgi:hydrogenase expression/formation protein HypC
MCLAVPGKIIDIDTTTPIRMGRVDFGGILREVCLEAVPEAALGDYVIVHAGFALNTLSEQEAWDSLEAFEELDEIESELRSADESTG